MGLFSKIKLSEILNAKPVSTVFGFDRGTPIDRYYIEKFLNRHRSMVTGDVLEIAENLYTKKFGSGNYTSHILHYDDSNPNATIVGDLCNTETLKQNAMNCFICTQTYNFIYNFRDAIKGSYFLLKPGGTLLATVASMSPISKYDADRWGDFWRFTPQSCQKMMEDYFSKEKILIEPLGNSAVTALFMKGFAIEEIKKEVDLDYNDEIYPLVIGIKAVK
jgi:hypothetical protein